MIVSYCVRMHHWTVEKALHAFALSRPPGIYKHYYIRQLYRYYHEAVPAAAVMPALPDWKAGDAPDSGDEGGEGENGAEAPPEHMEHDDVLGEEVSPAEAATVCGSIVEMIAGPAQDHRRAWFPGSQPVSLDRSNLELLRQRRCMVWCSFAGEGVLGEMKARRRYRPLGAKTCSARLRDPLHPPHLDPTCSPPLPKTPQVLGDVEGRRDTLHAGHPAVGHIPGGQEAGHAPSADALAPASQAPGWGAPEGPRGTTPLPGVCGV